MRNCVVYTLEVNHDIQNGGSFRIIINLWYENYWWFVKQPIKNGGWTSSVYSINIYIYVNRKAESSQVLTMVAGWNANRQRSNLFHIRTAFKKQLQQINGKQTFGNQIRTTFHRDPAAPSSTYTPRERRLRPWQSLVVVDDHLYSQSSKSKRKTIFRAAQKCGVKQLDMNWESMY